MRKWFTLMVIVLVNFTAFAQQHMHKKHHKSTHHKQPQHNKHNQTHQQEHHQTPPHKEYKTSDHSKYNTNTENEKHPEDIHDHPPEGHEEFDIPTRINLKLFPAVFSNTYGVELEFPIGTSFSVGLNTMYYYARQDNLTSIKSSRHDIKNGYRAELALRYYVKKKGPSGIFLQLYGGYNSILYVNGFTRPYSLLLRRKKEKEDVREVNDFSEPKPICAGLGIGYQLPLLPKRLIASISLGLDASQDKANQVLIFPFINPTVGYVF